MPRLKLFAQLKHDMEAVEAKLNQSCSASIPQWAQFGQRRSGGHAVSRRVDGMSGCVQAG